MHFWEHILAAGRTYYPWRNTLIRAVLSRHVDSVIAISRSLERFLRANGIMSTVQIYNGIDLNRRADQAVIDAFKRKYGLRGPNILFAGRVRRDKGVHLLLDAFETVREALPEARLVIAGERERAEALLSSAAEEVKAATIATDWLSAEELAAAYACSTVVATPSVYLDNFPNVNLEAMAAAKPVVGTLFGGTPEIVVDRQTGFLVNPRETPQFARALLKLLSDDGLARRMGAAGRKRVDELFSIERQATEYLELFRAH
jgi:glycosyltransferase involved in cell wall biosynthesis